MSYFLEAQTEMHIKTETVTQIESQPQITQASYISCELIKPFNHSSHLIKSWFHKANNHPMAFMSKSVTLIHDKVIFF